MNWQDLARTAAKLGLPTLGGALAGPAGAVAGKAIADALGADANPEAVREALAADPDAVIRLRQVEAEMQAEQNRHEEQLATIQVGDIQSARASTKDDTMRRWLAAPILVIPILLIVLYACFPGLDTSVWMLVIGTTLGWAGSVVGFYFGTSLGSAKRAEEISALKGGAR